MLDGIREGLQIWLGVSVERDAFPGPRIRGRTAQDLYVALSALAADREALPESGDLSLPRHPSSAVLPVTCPGERLHERANGFERDDE